MNMKKFVNILTLLLCVCIVSCDDSKDDAIELTVVGRDAIFTAVGGEMIYNLSTEADKVESDQSWCVPRLSGSVVTVTLEANTTLEGRTAAVTVTRGTDVLSFYVTQPGNLVPTPESGSVAFDAKGGEQRLSVYNDMPFTAVPADNWLTAQVDGSTLILRTNTNYTVNDLSTTVKLVSGSLESEIKVTQSGITLTPERTTLLMYNAGDEVTVPVNSTLPFIADCKADWLTVTYDESSLTLTATDNSGQPERATTVTLTSETLTATITVTQRAPIYSDYLGSWTLTGYDSGSPFTYNLTIDQATANSTYSVTGWGASAVATDSQYAIQANYDAASGLIFITSQENIAEYTDEEGEQYNVMYYGQVEMGGTLYYVSGSGYICYIGELQRDGSVQWMDGQVTLQSGVRYPVVGARYYIESQTSGKVLSFNVDTPFMRRPVMTKAAATRAFSGSIVKTSKNKTVETKMMFAE